VLVAAHRVPAAIKPDACSRVKGLQLQRLKVKSVTSLRVACRNTTGFNQNRVSTSTHNLPDQGMMVFNGVEPIMHGQLSSMVIHQARRHACSATYRPVLFIACFVTTEVRLLGRPESGRMDLCQTHRG